MFNPETIPKYYPFDTRDWGSFGALRPQLPQQLVPSSWLPERIQGQVRVKYNSRTFIVKQEYTLQRRASAGTPASPRHRLIFWAYTLNILWMCSWLSNTSGGGVILHLVKLTMSSCTCLPVGWSNNRRLVALRKHKAITGFTQLSNILSVVRLSSPYFVLLHVPSLSLSSVQDRGLGQW